SRFSFDSFRPIPMHKKSWAVIFEAARYRACASRPYSFGFATVGALCGDEKIAFTTCQMSNVCCAMFNVVVKTPDDLLTKPPNGKRFSHQVISSVSRFTSSSDIAQQTFDI